MTVELSVSAVRDAIYARSRPSDGGERTSAFLGRLFHQVMSGLLEPGAGLELLRDEASELPRYVYRSIVGPALSREQAALAASGPEVLRFWEATLALVRWLSELVATAKAQGVTDRELSELLRPERPVDRVLEGPGWRDTVRLVGQVDLLIEVPSGPRCVVELKSGQGAAEADLAQACLYHLILGGTGPLALLHFAPERTEVLLDEAALGPARTALLALIGALAKVTGEPEVAPEPASVDGAALGRRLTSAYREYGVEIRLDEPTIGPTFLRFPVTPGRGQVVSRLVNNGPNVQVRLELEAPPMISNERGRLALDVQRIDRQIVRFASVEAQIREAEEPTGGALVPVGVDLYGELRFLNLGDPLNCHVLVAGTTGSGKSEWLRFALSGLALRYTPEAVRFLLIDPKRNAFLELRGSPYVYGARGIVFPDEHDVVEVLEELAAEMEERYRAIADLGADDLARSGLALPRVVVCCDEYYDLITRSKDVEALITRLGAKARAAGIHLILATQQPSRKVITGALDANIPARVALRTEKAIESKMMLRERGAESLLGRGDLLFRDMGAAVRLQAPMTTVEERRRLFRG